MDREEKGVQGSDSKLRFRKLKISQATILYIISTITTQKGSTSHVNGLWQLSSRHGRQTTTGDHHANVFFKHFSNFSNFGVMKKTFAYVQISLKQQKWDNECISGQVMTPPRWENWFGRILQCEQRDFSFFLRDLLTFSLSMSNQDLPEDRITLEPRSCCQATCFTILCPPEAGPTLPLDSPPKS